MYEKKKSLALTWLIFLALVMPVSAFEITTLGDGSSTKNLTWSGTESNIEWVIMDRNFDVTTAEMLITGHPTHPWNVSNVSLAQGGGSIAVDPNRRVHICYWDKANGGDLVYAYRDENESIDTWHTTLIDDDISPPANGAIDCSIKVDSNNNPRIFYHVVLADNLKYAWYDGSWNTEMIESGDPNDIVNLQIDSEDKSHIAYGVDSGGTYYLWYGKKDGTWSKESVKALATIADTPFDLVLDSDDNPHIIYTNDTTSLCILDHAVKDGSWSFETFLYYSCSMNELRLDADMDSSDTLHVAVNYDYTCGGDSYCTRYTYKPDGGSWQSFEDVQSKDDQDYYPFVKYDEVYGYVYVGVDSYNNEWELHRKPPGGSFSLYDDTHFGEYMLRADGHDSVDMDNEGNFYAILEGPGTDYYANMTFMNSVYAINASIDTANEGVEDLTSVGRISNSDPYDFNVTAIMDYLRYNCSASWPDGDCNVTINFTATGTGTLTLSDILFSGGTQDPYPDIEIESVYGQGFSTNPNDLNGTINITVIDPGYGNATCNITIGETDYNNEQFNDESKDYDISIGTGTVEVDVNCTNDIDLYSTANETITFVAIKYILINEETGNEYSITDENISVYSPALNFNFTFNSTQNWVYYISNSSDDIRFNIEYTGLSGLITRDFNPALEEDNETRVCVAPEQTAYEQVIYSSTSSAVAVYSVFADCYVVMDYTKYAYSDAVMTRAFTIPKLYYLYTWEDGAKAVLVDVDGGTALEINLDLVEFARTTYSISILSEDISISAYTNTTFKINYMNNKDTIDEVTVTVKSGATELFSITESDSPDDFTIYYDHSLINLSAYDLLTIEVEKFYDGDSLGTVTKLFYPSGVSGFMNPWVAILFSFILMFFSLTFVAIRYVFGFFGIITTLMGMAILAMAPANNYILLMEAINAIILVFIIFLFKEEYAKVQ
jgi:hypothetical protein